MHITKDEKNKGSPIFRIEGKLDATSSPQLEKGIHATLEQGAKNILIDFSNIDYLSSAGMRLLLSMTKKLGQKGGKLILFSIHDDVMEIIRMAGFEQILYIFRDEANALKQL